MRILFVSRCLPLPRHFGDRLILFHLLAGLRSRGHHCRVVALARSGEDGATLEESSQLTDGLDVVAEVHRHPLSYLRRVPAPFPTEAAGCWHPAMWEAVSRRLDGGSVDLVHFFGGIQVYEHRDSTRGWPRLIQPYESYALWLTTAIAAARSPRTRLVLWLRRLLARQLERRIYLGFDRVLLNAAPDERTLRALVPHLPTAVIPQGVDGESEPVRLGDRVPARIVFVGNFAYRPNLEAALRLVREILPRVRRQLPAATLTLVGAAPPTELQDLGGEGVEVTGTVPDVVPWLGRARVFVSPLAWGAGLKNKVLEAMSAGTPVVATPLSCDGIPVRDGVHALLANTSRTLAEATVRVLGDDRLAGALARSARRLVEERFRWPLVIDLYESLYADLVANHAEDHGR